MRFARVSLWYKKIIFTAGRCRTRRYHGDCTIFLLICTTIILSIMLASTNYLIQQAVQSGMFFDSNNNKRIQNKLLNKIWSIFINTHAFHIQDSARQKWFELIIITKNHRDIIFDMHAFQKIYLLLILKFQIHLSTK